MEACGSAHYWARLFQSYGHKVKLIVPQFVKLFVRSNKNDRNDARAIAEAMTRPDMKFVAVKTVAQQDMLLRHRVRELPMKNKVALANQIRGLLMEFGVIIPKGVNHIKNLLVVLEQNQEKQSAKTMLIFKDLYERFKRICEEIKVREPQSISVTTKTIDCIAGLMIKNSVADIIKPLWHWRIKMHVWCGRLWRQANVIVSHNL